MFSLLLIYKECLRPAPNEDSPYRPLNCYGPSSLSRIARQQFLAIDCPKVRSAIVGQGPRAASLKADAVKINKLLKENEERRSVLEVKLRESDDRVGALGLELDATSREYEEFNARDTPIIADMEKELRVAYAYLDDTRDESERELIISKDREIVDLRENCKSLAQTNGNL